MGRTVPNVFPPKAEALFRPESAVDQDRCDVPEQVRIARFNRLLAALGGPNAFERTAVGVQDVVADGGCCVQVAGLLLRVSTRSLGFGQITTNCFQPIPLIGPTGATGWTSTGRLPCKWLLFSPPLRTVVVSAFPPLSMVPFNEAGKILAMKSERTESSSPPEQFATVGRQ